MELYELKVNMRTASGKCPARSFRREGKIPAVLYGPETDPILLTIGLSELELALKKGNVARLLFDLKIQNGQISNKSAMIKELQTDPLSRNYLHVDFYEISMDRKINVKVPVVIKGKSKGIELGGFLQLVRHELEISCFPNEIPEAFEIDITDLDIGDSVHVEDIASDNKIDILSDTNFTVLTILAAKKEEEPSAEEEELKGEEEAEEESEETPEK